MNELQMMIQSLDIQLDEICRAMEVAELAQFRVDYERLIPEVAAAQDRRAARKALSHLREVCGRYPAVHERTMPFPGGAAPLPPTPSQQDEPVRDLSPAALSNVMQDTCARIDARMQEQSGSSRSQPSQQADER